MATENSIEQSFNRWCKRHGFVRIKLKLNPGRGWPDSAVMLPGNVMCWVEFKGPTGVTSPQQDFVIAKMAKAGHQVFICRTLEEAIDAVAQISKRGEEFSSTPSVL